MSQSETSATPQAATPAADHVFVKTKRVVCDGGGSALGHPRTWLDMGVDNQVECKYCDRLFLFDVGEAV